MTTTATRPVPTSTRQHHLIGLGAAFGIGMLVAIQSRINGELGNVLGDGVAAALISFSTGLLILLIGVALIPAVRRSLGRVWQAIREPMRGYGGLRWWQCLGGLGGAYLVATQSITVSVIGVAVFTVAVVAGQAVSSLVVDRLGFGPAGPQPFTTLRVVGALAALVAVVLAVSDQLNHPGGLLLAVLPALGGVGTAVQQAINGRVARTASQDAYGACGVIFISAAAAVVRVVGVFVLGLGTIAGQLIASLFIDVVAPATDKAITFPVVAGTALALAAVVIAAVPNLRRH